MFPFSSLRALGPVRTLHTLLPFISPTPQLVPFSLPVCRIVTFPPPLLTLESCFCFWNLASGLGTVSLHRHQHHVTPRHTTLPSLFLLAIVQCSVLLSSRPLRLPLESQDAPPLYPCRRIPQCTLACIASHSLVIPTTPPPSTRHCCIDHPCCSPVSIMFSAYTSIDIQHSERAEATRRCHGTNLSSSSEVIVILEKEVPCRGRAVIFM